MNDQEQTHAAIAIEAQQFRQQQQTLLLGTLDETLRGGFPLASYTPFVLLENQGFGILTSRLAQHTQNMLCTPTASVLIIEPEHEASSPFARKRLSFQCNVTHHQRDSLFFENLVDKMQQQFGAIATLLAELPDFEPFELTPFYAEYVKGFGSAWRFIDGKLENAEPRRR